MNLRILAALVLCGSIAHAADDNRTPAGGAQIIAPISTAVPKPIEKANLKFSAFFDARFTHMTSERDSKGVTPQNGFMIEDGALYFGYAQDKLTLVLDLPFSRKQTPADGSSDNADFGFANGKAQAYGKYALNEWANITFGQFDTIYGVELNDSKDRVFGKTGIVYDLTLPVTHTGVMFDASFWQSGYAKVLVANPNNKGSLGNGGAQDEAGYEYGAAIGYSTEMLRGQVGYLTRRKDDNTGGSSERTLTDIIVGTTLGKFSLDLEYAIVDDPAKTKDDQGSGMFALATYKLNDKWLLGARYEATMDDPDGAGDFEETSMGGSIHYKASDAVELRGEYIGYTGKLTEDAKDDNTGRWSVGAVFAF